MVAVVHGMLAHHRETYKGEGNAVVIRLLGQEVCPGLLVYIIVGAEV